MTAIPMRSYSPGFPFHSVRQGAHTLSLSPSLRLLDSGRPHAPQRGRETEEETEEEEAEKEAEEEKEEKKEEEEARGREDPLSPGVPLRPVAVSRAPEAPSDRRRQGAGGRRALAVRQGGEGEES